MFARALRPSNAERPARAEGLRGGARLVARQSGRPQTLLAREAKLPEPVIAKQLDERTELTALRDRCGAGRRDHRRRQALQQAGVIKADVDVKDVVAKMIDTRFNVALGDLPTAADARSASRRAVMSLVETMAAATATSRRGIPQ